MIEALTFICILILFIALRQAVEQAKGVEAVDAMREALQAEHEPVAHRHWCECDTDEDGNPVFGWEYFDEASCPECQPLYTTPPSIDALIAQAIKEHDEKMTVIKTVNTRKIAQPYIDELIAEIEAIETFGVSGGHGERSSQAISVWKLKPILDKYRGV